MLWPQSAAPRSHHHAHERRARQVSRRGVLLVVSATFAQSSPGLASSARDVPRRAAVDHPARRSRLQSTSPSSPRKVRHAPTTVTSPRPRGRRGRAPPARPCWRSRRRGSRRRGLAQIAIQQAELTASRRRRRGLLRLLRRHLRRHRPRRGADKTVDGKSTRAPPTCSRAAPGPGRSSSASPPPTRAARRLRLVRRRLRRHRRRRGYRKPSAATRQGAAYVFTRSGTTWTQQQKLTAADGAAVDYFGYSVALSGDTALVGACDKAVGGNTSQGAAYVFTRSAGTWTQQQKLTAPTAPPATASAARRHRRRHRPRRGRLQGRRRRHRPGAAYVFTRSGTTSGPAAGADRRRRRRLRLLRLTRRPLRRHRPRRGLRQDRRRQHQPGRRLRLHAQRRHAWTQQQRLTAADGAPATTSAAAVALYGDTALVGAPGKTVGSQLLQGAAYVFTRSGSDLDAAAAAERRRRRPGDDFGHAVALSGETALVGAYDKTVGINACAGRRLRLHRRARRPPSRSAPRRPPASGRAARRRAVSWSSARPSRRRVPRLARQPDERHLVREQDGAASGRPERRTPRRSRRRPRRPLQGRRLLEADRRPGLGRDHQERDLHRDPHQHHRSPDAGAVWPTQAPAPSPGT